MANPTGGCAELGGLKRCQWLGFEVVVRVCHVLCILEAL
jgi:hypothetical protein